MFGEDIIIGQVTRNIDEKNRIIMPKFTKAEKGDKLVIYKENEYFSIYNVDKLLERFDKDTLKEIGNFFKNKKQIDEEVKSWAAIATLDSNKRMTLPQEVIERYDLKDNVYMEGALTHLNIYRTKKR